MSSTAKIRELNDAFRTTIHGNGDVYLTAGVAALPEEEQGEIIRRVRRFNTFTPENDPHYEHDFGSFEHAGKKVFWKIDYYDLDLRTTRLTRPTRTARCASSRSCSRRTTDPPPCAAPSGALPA